MTSDPSNVQPSLKRQPKYRQLAEQLRRRIESGELQPGVRIASFGQMRAQFGLTNNTIEKVYELLARDGLIVREPKRGTFVAPSRRRQASGVIGLYGFGFGMGYASSYWVELLEGIHRQAGKSQAQILLLQGKVGNGWEKVDGVVLCDTGRRTTHYIPPQVPVVGLLTARPERSCVTAEEYSGLRLATEHLLNLGHRRIAYLHGSGATAVSQRLLGYRDALHEAGVTPQDGWRRALTGKNDVGAQFIAAGKRDMAAWLCDTGRNGWNKIGCSALLCHNDETAIGALQALNHAGLRVPDDVSVVGFDGLEIGEYSSPRLTTVVMPLQVMGKAAVELLQRQITADEASVHHEVFPVQLRMRESTTARN